jgi:signal transduction histidine kinase
MTSNTMRDGHVLNKPMMDGVLPALVTGAAYFLGVETGLALSPTAQAQPLIALAPAILLGCLLLQPPRNWWRLMVAALAAQLLVQLRAGLPMPAALVPFIVNGGEALAGAACLRWLLQGRAPAAGLHLGALRQVLAFLFCCVGLAGVAGALLEAVLAGVLARGGAPWWQTWPAHLLSHGAATLLLVPVLAGWHAGLLATLRAQPWTRDLEAGLLLLILAVLNGAAWLGAGADNAGEGRALPSVLALLLAASMPLLCWSALRFGPWFTSCTVLLCAAAALAGAMHGEGGAAGWLQLYLGALALPLLPLAAALHERRAAHQALQRIDARVESEIAGRRRAVEAVRLCHAEGRRQRAQLNHLTRACALGELSGAFAHELNQPLAAILANAHAARRLLGRAEPDLAQIREILDDIVSEDQRAGDVIQRLRALFSNGEPASQALDLNQLVREAVELTRASLCQQRIALTLELSPLPCRIEGDRVQLQQVLLNLIVNAAEAMRACPDAARVLRVATGGLEGGAAVVTISDNGSGIATRPIARIFEPFFTTKAHGLGFGLSISRAIVTQHGGRLEAENNPERGSSFRIILPPGAAHERP